jgi:hypothetical protein
VADPGELGIKCVFEGATIMRHILIF